MAYNNKKQTAAKPHQAADAPNFPPTPNMDSNERTAAGSTTYANTPQEWRPNHQHRHHHIRYAPQNVGWCQHSAEVALLSLSVGLAPW